MESRVLLVPYPQHVTRVYVSWRSKSVHVDALLQIGKLFLLNQGAFNLVL